MNDPFAKSEMNCWPYPEYYREWLDELFEMKKPRWQGWSHGRLFYAFCAETGLRTSDAKPIFKDYCERRGLKLPFSSLIELIIFLCVVGLFAIPGALLLGQEWGINHFKVGTGFIWYLIAILGYGLRKPLRRRGMQAVVSGFLGALLIFIGGYTALNRIVAMGLVLIAVAHFIRLGEIMHYRWYGSNAVTSKRTEMTAGSGGFIAFIVFGFTILVCAGFEYAHSFYFGVIEGLLLFSSFFYWFTISKLDTKNEEGITPLMQAILGEKMEEVRKLLDDGADPNIKGRDRRTSLDLALAANNSEAVALIQAAGGLATGKAAPPADSAITTEPVDWKELKLDLATARTGLDRAAELLPNSDDPVADEARFKDFDSAIAANDLVKALDELESVGKQHAAPAEYWHELEKVADLLRQPESAIRFKARAV